MYIPYVGLKIHSSCILRKMGDQPMLMRGVQLIDVRFRPYKTADV